MAVVKCAQGHYYDDSKFDECPHCKDGLHQVRKETYEDDLEKLKTQALAGSVQDNIETVELNVDMGFLPDDEKTVGIYNLEAGTELLTGWLVCIKGPSRGRDYKLFHGWNRIGRGLSMEVYIPEDQKISAQNQAAIVFDDRKTRFHLVNEEGTLTYLNGTHILESTEIKNGDRITMGDSELVFIAFCTEERKWEEES